MAMVIDGDEFYTTDEACAILEVKAATLYAYVSRGLLRSYRQGLKRRRLYHRAEVEQLRTLGPAQQRTLTTQQDESESELPLADSWIPYT